MELFQPFLPRQRRSFALTLKYRCASVDCISLPAQLALPALGASFRLLSWESVLWGERKLLNMLNIREKKKS